MKELSTALEIRELCKNYPSFTLDHVSFSVERGTVMGFIGRNGAGKSTTLKSALNLVHPSGGEVFYFGLPLKEHEKEIKQRIGYVGGSVSWYRKKKIQDIVAVTATFYDSWDALSWQKYCAKFALDESKTPEQLSEGMKVKLNIALALSHKAELLILDEPTSGLDPVSRDKLLEIFLQLADAGVAVLFSTHITSDLEKCADHITYIKNGRIVHSCTREELIDKYRLLPSPAELSDAQHAAVIGESRSVAGKTLLIASENAKLFAPDVQRLPSLEEIMVHLEKEVM